MHLLDYIVSDTAKGLCFSEWENGIPIVPSQKKTMRIASHHAMICKVRWFPASVSSDDNAAVWNDR